MRENILLDEGWHFHRGDIKVKTPADKGPLYSQSKTERMRWGAACVEYNDTPDSYAEHSEFSQESWKIVKLPHDYVIEGTPSPEENNALGYLHYKNAWYRKHLTFSDADKGKRITLFFEGVATHATVYFNGSPVVRNYCGYTGFEADITDLIRYDSDNVIAVYVNTQSHEGWWYEGGGIYRDVWLVKTDKTSIDRYGIFVHAHRKTDEAWELHAEITLNNISYKKEDVRLEIRMLDAENITAAATELSGVAENFGKTEFKAVLPIKNPHLWDINDPYLYTAEVMVYKNGVLCDSDITATGFREFKADPDKGLFLNGKHIKIFGVCMHEDCGLTGKAVPENIQKYKISLIKEMGANGYRCSHYPQSRAIMDALDEQGLIALAETRWFDSSEFGLRELEFLIKANRNRPSVYCWSIGNEESLFKSDEGRRIFKRMKAFAERLDPTRPITAAVDKEPGKAVVQSEVDIVGVNYNLDAFDKLHKTYPQKSIFSSECCATGSTRDWYYDDNPQKGYINAYDKDTNKWFLGRERTFKFMMEREYIQGFYQWNSFEHRGECVWPRLCSASGAIDLFLQKKDAFYQNLSHWTDKPMIHLMPHWNLHEFAGSCVDVRAYTNCDEAELFLNGQNLGRVEVEKYGHAEWFVKFVSGKLEVIGYKNKKRAAYDFIETTGEPCKLQLRLENNNFLKCGGDAAIITCYTVDKDGREVPDASPEVSFFTNKAGYIIGTGSDTADHTPPKCTVRKMYAGKITAAVMITDTEKPLEIYVQADGYKNAMLKIKI